MPERPGCHLDYDDRCVIEEGIEAGLSASAIARRLEVSPSTVTREVKADLCQDFGHGSSRNHAAMGSLPSAGLVRSKNNSMARAGIW